MDRVSAYDVPKLMRWRLRKIQLKLVMKIKKPMNSL